MNRLNLVQVSFLNVFVMPLCFYERPTLLPVFANGKKSEEHFFCIMQVFCKNEVMYHKLVKSREYSQLYTIDLQKVSQESSTFRWWGRSLCPCTGSYSIIKRNELKPTNSITQMKWKNSQKQPSKNHEEIDNLNRPINQ